MNRHSRALVMNLLVWVTRWSRRASASTQSTQRLIALLFRTPKKNGNRATPPSEEKSIMLPDTIYCLCRAPFMVHCGRRFFALYCQTLTTELINWSIKENSVKRQGRSILPTQWMLSGSNWLKTQWRQLDADLTLMISWSSATWYIYWKRYT